MPSPRSAKLDYQRKDSGAIIVNAHNAWIYLRAKHPDLVFLDDFDDRIYTGPNPHPREWNDHDENHLLIEMQRSAIPQIGIAQVRSAVEQAALDSRRHSVRAWIDSLRWDGEPRCAEFFADHFGADRAEYSSAVSRNFWVSLLARIYRPGCQVDNMVVLESLDQGRGKSQALKAIGGKWYSEQHESASDPKRFAEVLQGKILIEISEFDAFERAETSKVKQSISCMSDRYRAAFARYATDHDRQCIMVATTNTDDWHRDPTGARRFWPIRCNGMIDVPAISAAREQLFAEAKHLFSAGAAWWLVPADTALAEQNARRDEVQWLEEVTDFIGSQLPGFSANDVLQHLKLDADKRTLAARKAVGKALRILGWENKVTRDKATQAVSRQWFPREPQ